MLLNRNDGVPILYSMDCLVLMVQNRSRFRFEPIETQFRCCTEPKQRGNLKSNEWVQVKIMSRYLYCFFRGILWLCWNTTERSKTKIDELRLLRIVLWATDLMQSNVLKFLIWAMWIGTKGTCRNSTRGFPIQLALASPDGAKSHIPRLAREAVCAAEHEANREQSETQKGRVCFQQAIAETPGSSRSFYHSAVHAKVKWRRIVCVCRVSHELLTSTTAVSGAWLFEPSELV